jgi:hypothetical protein
MLATALAGPQLARKWMLNVSEMGYSYTLKGLSSENYQGSKVVPSILLRKSRWIFFSIIFYLGSVQKHKTVNRYLIDISWDRLVNLKQIRDSGTWGGIIISILVSETTEHNNSMASSAATVIIENPPIFLHHEVKALLCSGTWRYEIIIVLSSQIAVKIWLSRLNRRCYYNNSLCSSNWKSVVMMYRYIR